MRALRRAFTSRGFNVGVCFRRAMSSCRSRVIDMATRDGELRVFLVAGEVSGDSIGSRLMEALKKLSPFPVRFAGIGGALMHKEGLQSLFPMEEIAVMGVWELLPHINRIRIKLKEAVEGATLFHPHVVVTIDSKGFSFRFLKHLRDKAMPEQATVHVHYVAPSFWAWKQGESRLRNLSQIVDHMLCLVPFEEKTCKLNGLAATFVGHPLLEDALIGEVRNHEVKSSCFLSDLKVPCDGDSFRHEHGLSPKATVITLIPGSRLQEVTLMLPIFLRAIELLRSEFSDLSIVIPIAPNSYVENYITREMQSWPQSAILIPGASQEQKYNAFGASAAALCTSGSAVMEIQLARLPCVVAYRAHILTEWLIQIMTKLRYISLPNILLDSTVIPEVLFRACTPHNLAKALRSVIFDEDIRARQKAAAEEVLRLLCPPSENMSEFEELGDSSTIWHPSMIAAATILTAQKQEVCSR